MRGSQPELERLIGESPPRERRIFERSLLQLPLRLRHADQAATEWANLRATFLSNAILAEFEEWCLNELEQQVGGAAADLSGAAR
jgi:hypothetical protein